MKKYQIILLIITFFTVIAIVSIYQSMDGQEQRELANHEIDERLIPIVRKFELYGVEFEYDGQRKAIVASGIVNSNRAKAIVGEILRQSHITGINEVYVQQNPNGIGGSIMVPTSNTFPSGIR